MIRQIKSQGRQVRSALTAALGLALLGGCISCSNEPTAAGEPVIGKLKVAFWNQEAFDQDYGDYFAAKFPQLEVEVLSTDSTRGPGKNALKELVKFVAEQKPDLLITTSIQYEMLAVGQKLMDLSPMITKDKFDLDNMLPAAVSYLKAKGGGKLYGLAPQFSSSVLFYNQDLFDAYKVPYPKDRMTWEEMLQLADKFRGAKTEAGPVYGFHIPYMTSPYSIVRYVGQGYGLEETDAAARKVIVNSEAWRKVFFMVTEAWRNGTVPVTTGTDKQRWEQEDVKNTDLFSQGRAAMTINNTWQLDRLKQSAAKLSYGMVPLPSADGSEPRQPHFNVNPIYVIPAGAGHPENAWKVIQYFNGPEAAKVESKTSNALLTRPAFIKEVEGHSLTPFYQVKYSEGDAPSEYSYSEIMPVSFYEDYRMAADEQLTAILDGKRTVEQSLKRLQEQGQQVLDAARAKAAAEQQAGK